MFLHKKSRCSRISEISNIFEIKNRVAVTNLHVYYVDLVAAFSSISSSGTERQMSSGSTHPSTAAMIQQSAGDAPPSPRARVAASLAYVLPYSSGASVLRATRAGVEGQQLVLELELELP